LAGLLFFVLVCCIVIVLAGGGWTFLQRPVGAVYLTLWSGWWLLITIGRQRGVPSAYDRSQRLILGLGIVALVALIVGPPWEYAHFSAPFRGMAHWPGSAWPSLPLVSCCRQ